ncbi:unnamed protein product [Fraxinus pennsylvanica]|uniref:Uncharacterized protein n=1 Tax=Fraxinus pennsylvanica TaxID=56036 RepID=A0AAD1ZLK5_9LAMI|nr:unnamed protein product [Fraxinus pennsylvanica]
MVTESSINQKLNVMDIDHEPSWMDHVVNFLTNEEWLEDNRASRSIRSRAPRYCMIRGVLFHKSLTLPYFKCLRTSKSTYALTEAHEEICGNHQRARALTFKLIRYR